MGAIKEAETLLLWKGLNLTWCPAPGRVLHSGNQELRDTNVFSPGHGVQCFLRAGLKLTPPPGHFSSENQLFPENMHKCLSLLNPLSRHLDTHLV